MAEGAPSPDFPEFKDETVQVWNSLAEWWDDAIGDGNDFQTVLIEPTTGTIAGVAAGRDGAGHCLRSGKVRPTHG